MLAYGNVYGKGIDEVLERTSGTQTIYYQSDHQGSITHLTNASGAVIERYRYDAYGVPTFYNATGAVIGNSAYGNAFLFTGQPFLTWDTYLYRARLYNAYLGRFMSEDPTLYDGGDYNLFRYCDNDPVDQVDPMGLAGNELQTFEVHRSEDRLWDLAQHFDSSNLTHGNFLGFGQVTVTGQLAGGPADLRTLKNAKPGNLNDRDAPNRLELGEVDNYGHYKVQHLQLKHNSSDLTGMGVAEEHVVKKSGNLNLEPSGPTLFSRGDIRDRVGPKTRPAANITGELTTRQTYRIYYGFPYEVHYYDIPQVFKQHTHIEQGKVTAADVTPW